MSKKLSIITLGKVLQEIEEEGRAKGEDWSVPRLYVTRNEQSPNNIQLKLRLLQKKRPEITEEEVKEELFFPFYGNKESHWRVYSREEADDLKNRIKQRRKYL